MDQELRDLVEQMRQLIPVLQGMNKPPGTSSNQPADKMSRGVDRMVVALGQLVVKLDATKKTQHEEQEAVKKFANAVERTARNLDNENKEREATTDALKEEIKARLEANRRSKLTELQRDKEDNDRRIQEVTEKAKARNLHLREEARNLSQSKSSSAELFDSLSSTGGSAEVLKGKFYDLADNSMSAQIGLRGLGAITEGAGKSLKLFATGLIEGQRGAELSAKAVTELATPFLDLAKIVGGIATFASFFVPGGPLIKWGLRAAGALLGLGSAAGKTALSLNELSAKQIDAQLKSFNALSQAGVKLDTGFIGVLDTLQTLGMTMSEVEQFNQLIGENNRSLAIMGGTATRGAKQFSEVAGQLVKGELGKQLEYMGVTQEEQRKATLSYMSIQARTGQLELNNTNKLIEGSANFIKELDLAAQMSGTTRKDQQEAREAAMAETRFRAAMTMAIKEGNVAEIERLKRVEQVAGMMRKTLGEEAFVGALQLGASRGALTTEAAQSLEVSTGFTNIIENTQLTAEQMYQQIVANGVVQADSLAAYNQLGGDIKGFQIASVSLRDEEARIAQLQKAAAEQGFTGVDAIKRFTEFVKNNQDKVSQETKDLLNANRAQQAATQTMERGLSEFNAATLIHKKASETFATAVEAFGNAVGVKVPGGTTQFAPPGAAPAAAGSTVAQAKQAHQQQQIKIKNLEEQALAAEDRANALEKDAKASRQEKDAARTKANELAAQLAQESRLLRQTQMAEQSARRTERKMPAGPLDTKLLESLSSGGITDKRAQANILAQVQAESGGVAKSENLNYSPERLLQMFPKKFANIQEATQVAAGGPEAIGERVYGGRMGNTAAGEGFKYRGRGLIQLTGKDNYKKFGDLIGVDLVQNPDLANDPEIARKLAVAYFQDKQKSGVDLTRSRDVSKAVGHVDIGGSESMQRESLAQKILEQMPKARDGGTFRGPMSGYPAVLHGNEAVIPLKNGAVPVMMPALDELVSSNRAVDAQVQVLRNEMGSMMRELTTAIQTMKETGSQERMIQLLESMSRSQQSTATATQRMAQLASN
jgi:predicted chitinase